MIPVQKRSVQQQEERIPLLLRLWRALSEQHGLLPKGAAQGSPTALR